MKEGHIRHIETLVKQNFADQPVAARKQMMNCLLECLHYCGTVKPVSEQ